MKSEMEQGVEEGLKMQHEKKKRRDGSSILIFVKREQERR